MEITVNGKVHTIEAESDTPLLWVVREQLGLTGTKFGCGIAQCGACMMHVNGKPMKTCVLPVGAVAGAEITTIEGIGGKTSCIRFNRRGSMLRCRNVVTVNRVKLCLRLHYWQQMMIQAMTILIVRCRVMFVDVACMGVFEQRLSV